MNSVRQPSSPMLTVLTDAIDDVARFGREMEGSGAALETPLFEPSDLGDGAGIETDPTETVDLAESR